MRWAPQDYRTSRVRNRSALTADPMLRLVYLELLNALHEAGGALPSDAAFLADELLLPVAEIERCLPILILMSEHSLRGGIVLENGTVSNVRVCEDLRAAEEYREKQSERGAKGGRPPGKPSAKHSQSGGKASAKPAPSETKPKPLPLPTPEPNPKNGSGGPAWTGDPDTDAMITALNAAVREIADLEPGGDQATIMRDITGANGKAQPVSRADVLRGMHLSLSLRDALARLAAAKAKQPPVLRRPAFLDDPEIWGPRSA